MKRYNIYERHNDEFHLAMRTSVPERKLLSAIVRRAILDYISGDDRRDDVKEWIFSRASAREAFSFAWICEQLDLNLKLVTEAIKKLGNRGNGNGRLPEMLSESFAVNG